ncbi:MAG: hypothetical protein JOZ74_06170 [Bradyrhizobium sp.]|nr:hypothetical protein [Bradyrhizobium sp.]
MSSFYRQEIEDGVFEDVGAACVELVPVAPMLCQAPKLARSRPNASFVAQLIATAEQDPQTRQQRRAAPADALSAYSAQERQLRRDSAARPVNLEKAA